MTVPPAYVLLRGAGVRAAVRRDLAALLGAWLLETPLGRLPGGEPVSGGRGAAYRATLPGGLRAVVRPYLRGGFVARWARETFLGPRPRPLRELTVTVAARALGAPVPDVLAARVEGGWLGYRGTLVTAEVAGVPLIEALRQAHTSAARQRAAGLAGDAVGVLHRAGLRHADLNMTNLLVPVSAGDATAAIVDLDRARLFPALSDRARRRKLRRLERSARKLDPLAAVVDAEVRAAFCAAYQRAVGSCVS